MEHFSVSNATPRLGSSLRKTYRHRCNFCDVGLAVQGATCPSGRVRRSSLSRLMTVTTWSLFHPTALSASSQGDPDRYRLFRGEGDEKGQMG